MTYDVELNDKSEEYETAVEYNDTVKRLLRVSTAAKNALDELHNSYIYIAAIRRDYCTRCKLNDKLSLSFRTHYDAIRLITNDLNMSYNSLIRSIRILTESSYSKLSKNDISNVFIVYNNRERETISILKSLKRELERERQNLKVIEDNKIDLAIDENTDNTHTVYINECGLSDMISANNDIITTIETVITLMSGIDGDREHLIELYDKLSSVRRLSATYSDAVSNMNKVIRYTDAEYNDVMSEIRDAILDGEDSDICTKLIRDIHKYTISIRDAAQELNKLNRSLNSKTSASADKECHNILNNIDGPLSISRRQIMLDCKSADNSDTMSNISNMIRDISNKSSEMIDKISDSISLQ